MYTYFIAFVGTTVDGGRLSRAFRQKKISLQIIYWVGILRIGHGSLYIPIYTVVRVYCTIYIYYTNIYACHDR